MAVPKGHAGSWFATWEGESLPCIHQHCVKGGRYIDPGVNDHPAWPRFIAALQADGKAILTTSHPVDRDGLRRRKSYVGIWPVSDVQVREGVLLMNLGPPLQRFRH